MIASSLRTLLDGLIDYAGLFPPAALSMQDAVRNYARYRDEPYAWALGRFVVPADRAAEVPRDFPLSLTGGLRRPEPTAPDPTGWPSLRDTSSPVSTTCRGGLANQSGPGPLGPAAGGPPVAEVKATTAADVERIARDANDAVVYVEINDLSLLDAIAQHGLRAKIRTGGLTPDALPPVSDVAAFLRACKEAGVAFKATAGLHHPLRCVKPLTYDADAPTGTMHGFLNVFLAAAMLEHADAILSEEDARAFAFDDEAAWWHGHRVTTDELRTMRREFATSFGSCSFEEPISDLRALGWLD